MPGPYSSASALNHTDFLVMEYVPGKSLDHLIGRKGLHLTEALRMRPPSSRRFLTAIQEQMGLKLLPRKGLIEVVVDHLQRPIEN